MPICCVRRVYKYGARRRPLYREIHLFLATILHCRRLPHPVVDVSSVSGEQAPKPKSPRVPARGRGRIRFLGSAVVTARWTSSSHYARCSPISIDGLLLLPSCRQPHCKNVYLFLLFGFISFLLLALDPMNLIQIVVLILIHISVIHVVTLFLIVRINSCITKLLLFPTTLTCENSEEALQCELSLGYCEATNVGKVENT